MERGQKLEMVEWGHENVRNIGYKMDHINLEPDHQFQT